MVSPRHELDAKETALQLINDLRIQRNAMPTIGLHLGAGWEHTLPLEDAREVLLRNLHGFTSPQKTSTGEEPRIVYGFLNGLPVVTQIGRVHLSDPPADRVVQDMVRLQAEMFIHLGVKRFIMTCGAGRTDDVFSADNATHETREILTGDVVLINGFLTIFAQNLPGYSTERGSPNAAIDWAMFQHAMAYVTENHEFRKRLHTGGYAMINGPHWEGRYDRHLLGIPGLGVKAIGFGLLPEACIVSLYRASHSVSLLPIALVVDAADRGTLEDTPEITETKKHLPGFLRFLLRRLTANHSR